MTDVSNDSRDDHPIYFMEWYKFEAWLERIRALVEPKFSKHLKYHPTIHSQMA